MRRLPQLVLILTTLANVWLLMQAVHELGHVVGGLLTGAVIKHVMLHPMEISRTDFGANPSPLIACWSGPFFGAILPVMAWLLAQWQRQSYAYWLKFFAGFCLIANGAYLAVGVRDGVGDAGDLLSLGSPPWQLYLFGAIAMPVGLWLWNGLGSSFGLGNNAESVRWPAATGSLLLLAATVVVELLLA
ncbi:MAG: hypothetical protein JWP89_1539 [Schlesneria sp.]|nr:hypothetical protein [Schlesneria sp.]